MHVNMTEDVQSLSFLSFFFWSNPNNLKCLGGVMYIINDSIIGFLNAPHRLVEHAVKRLLLKDPIHSSLYQLFSVQRHKDAGAYIQGAVVRRSNRP